MYTFKSFLKELCSSTDVKFKLSADDSDLDYDGLLDAEDGENVYLNISLGTNKAVILLPKQYENCKNLLKYTIERKYKELFSVREQYIMDILEGKEVALDNIENNYPFLSKGFTLMLISVEGSVSEALNVIRNLYNNENIISIIHGNDIVAIGDFDDVPENAEGIKTSINSELYCKCYVSYEDNLNDIYQIKKAYENAKEAIYLGKKFRIREEIYVYSKMLFEKLVYNIDKDVKGELLKKFKEKLDLFDSEIINTIEEFVNSDLNISDAARKLYIHRNTLIYRLDKIKKETGFDIRKFKEATVFITAFLVWKENND